MDLLEHKHIYIFICTYAPQLLYQIPWEFIINTNKKSYDILSGESWNNKYNMINEYNIEFIFIHENKKILFYGNIISLPYYWLVIIIYLILRPKLDLSYMIWLF